MTIDFLRRRYAAAILRDDADTAGRLRLQLDGIMNGAAGAAAPRAAARPEALGLDAVPGPRDAISLAAGPPAGPPATERAPDRRGPRLCLVPAVTGLLEGPGPGRRQS
jgi:hypothetical protein